MKSVDVIYKGSGRINFVTQGVRAIDITNGDIIYNIPKDIYDKEMKNDPRYSIVKEKKETNKMEKETKGVE